MEGGYNQPRQQIELSGRNWSCWNQVIGQSFRSTLKKKYLAKFYQAPTQQVKNNEKSNEVVQAKTHTIYYSNTNY